MEGEHVGNLCISRDAGQAFVIDPYGPSPITVRVVRVRGYQQVQLLISAARRVKIMREELLQQEVAPCGSIAKTAGKK